MKRYVDRLIEQVKENPQKPLVVDRDGTRITTRNEFLNTARRIAALIRRKNIPANSCIPIVLDSCMEYLAADYACWMTHNASVHLGTHMPQQRIDYIASDVNAPIIIDNDFIAEAISCEPDGRIDNREETDYAVAFYTSGSTGNPKGVIYTDGFFWKGNQNLQCSTNDSFLENDSYAPTTPLYFVVMQLIYGALWAGATVHLLSFNVKTDIHNMEKYLTYHRISVGFMPPTMLREFNNRSKFLKRIITGGEKLVNATPPEGYLVHQIYGQTEAPFYVLSYTLDKYYERVPMIPIGDIEVKLVDNEGNTVKQGQEGEMLVKVPIPPIYINDKEKNERIRKEGWLHTGDIMKQNKDGQYLYINRKDWMVKINGQRIEPGEIEMVMRHVPEVNKCVVKAFSSNNAVRNYLVAFYTAENDINNGYLIEELSKKLPDYMVPKIFVRLDEFPKNANGKIDRKNLLAPEEALLLKEYIAPANETEDVLCRVFAEALDFKRIGVNDDFFELGGNSIQMMKIQQLCNSTLSNISTNDIYLGRTPKKIAELLAKKSKQEKEILDDYPLSGIQNSYFQICMQAIGMPVFNVSKLVQLGNDVDLNRLAHAIVTTVNNHPAFFTRLTTDKSGEVRQKFVKEYFSVKVEKVTQKEFNTIKNDLIQPFYLLRDRLFRFRLFDTGSCKYMFSDIHHIIYDGESQTIFYQDLEKAYWNKALDVEDWSSLEMAAEEGKMRKSNIFNLAQTWYRKTFEGLGNTKHKYLYPTTSEVADEIKVNLDVNLESIDKFCKDSNITMNIFTTAAYALLLGRYFQDNDVLLLSAYNARSDKRTKNTVGLFARPLFERIQWNEEYSVKNYLQSVKKTILEGMQNSIYSYLEMQQDIAFPEDFLFIYQGDIVSEPKIGGCTTTEIILNKKRIRPILETHLFRNGKENRLEIEIFYRESCYRRKEIIKMIEDYQTILRLMINSNILKQK